MQKSNRKNLERPGVAIVTGASSGLGAAFARSLGAAEPKLSSRLPPFDEIWLVARRLDRLEELAKELRSSNPALRVRCLALDLVLKDSIKSLAAELKGSGKHLSILINNAGYGTYGPFDEVDIERQLGQIDLNCRALAECCGRLGQALKEGSMLLNVASLAAFAPLGGFAMYAASKAFVLSLSVALAAEWKGRGIRVCALCPGPVQSEFSLVASDGARKEVRHGYSAELTAARALYEAAGGRWISLPRPIWKLRRLAAILAGPKLSAVFAYRFMRRPHQKND
ncbi:hypothetical protein MASR2M78_23290 [Treponema sp.]